MPRRMGALPGGASCPHAALAAFRQARSRASSARPSGHPFPLPREVGVRTLGVLWAPRLPSTCTPSSCRSVPTAGRPRPGRPYFGSLARGNAAPVRCTCERSERSEGSGAAHTRGASGPRGDESDGDGASPFTTAPPNDRAGTAQGRFLRFFRFFRSAHARPLRPPLDGRAHGRAQRRVRSIRARRLIPLLRSGAFQARRCAGRCP
jgi:hypothetical protein